MQNTARFAPLGPRLLSAFIGSVGGGAPHLRQAAPHSFPDNLDSPHNPVVLHMVAGDKVGGRHRHHHVVGRIEEVAQARAMRKSGKLRQLQLLSMRPPLPLELQSQTSQRRVQRLQMRSIPH